MYQFSKSSADRLATCDYRLQQLFDTVIQRRDCTIAHGHRGEAVQNKLYEKGLSQLKWPNSDHNKTPSHAVDVYPYINGSMRTDRDECLAFSGFVLGVEAMMGIKLGWGGDWDRDDSVLDHRFSDLGHFYLLED